MELSEVRIAVLGGVHLDDFGTAVPAEFVLQAAVVTAVTVEGPEQVERRVTATRLFLVGIFAFAWKKAHKLSYLVVNTDEGIAVFECRSLTPLELRARLGPWLARFRELSSPEAQVTDHPADRLRRLVALHADGLVTDDEFEQKRNEIIAEL